VDDEDKHVWVTRSSQVLKVRMFLYIVLPKVNLSKVFFITYAVFKVAELDAVVTPEEQVVSIDQIINPSMLFRDVDTLKVNISSGSFLARISSILIVVDCWSFLFLLFHVLLYNMSVKSFSIRVVL
jgi:hypothetical protein